MLTKLTFLNNSCISAYSRAALKWLHWACSLSLYKTASVRTMLGVCSWPIEDSYTDSFWGADAPTDWEWVGRAYPILSVSLGKWFNIKFEKWMSTLNQYVNCSNTHFSILMESNNYDWVYPIQVNFLYKWKQLQLHFKDGMHLPLSASQVVVNTFIFQNAVQVVSQFEKYISTSERACKPLKQLAFSSHSRELTYWLLCLPLKYHNWWQFMWV